MGTTHTNPYYLNIELLADASFGNQEPPESYVVSKGLRNIFIKNLDTSIDTESLHDTVG